MFPGIPHLTPKDSIQCVYPRYASSDEGRDLVVAHVARSVSTVVIGAADIVAPRPDPDPENAAVRRATGSQKHFYRARSGGSYPLSPEPPTPGIHKMTLSVPRTLPEISNSFSLRGDEEAHSIEHEFSIGLTIDIADLEGAG